MITRFEEVSMTTSYSGICEICGKRVRRTVTAMQTLNPWNRVGDRLKTREEIYVELSARLDDIRKHPMHEKCARHKWLAARAQDAGREP